MKTTNTINTINKQLEEQVLARWAERTVTLPEERSRVPIKVLLGEALDLARVIENNYATTEFGGKTRLGLDSIAGVHGVTPVTATEIRELQLAVSAAQADYLAVLEKADDTPIERSAEILDELRAALSFLLEDGRHPEGAAQLGQLRDQFSRETSHDGIAMALEAYGEIAQRHLRDLRSFGGFEPALVDESLQVARALRERSAERLTGEVAQRKRQTLALRDRLTAALLQRMTAARRAIRYVFRDEPEIVRQASSEYERRRRRERSESAPTDMGPPIAGTEATLEVPVAGA